MMELDLTATCRRESPTCSRPAASLEATAGYEELVRCGRIGLLPSESARPHSGLTADALKSKLLNFTGEYKCGLKTHLFYMAPNSTQLSHIFRNVKICSFVSVYSSHTNSM